MEISEKRKKTVITLNYVFMVLVYGSFLVRNLFASRISTKLIPYYGFDFASMENAGILVLFLSALLALLIFELFMRLFVKIAVRGYPSALLKQRRRPENYPAPYAELLLIIRIAIFASNLVMGLIGISYFYEPFAYLMDAVFGVVVKAMTVAAIGFAIYKLYLNKENAGTALSAFMLPVVLYVLFL